MSEDDLIIPRHTNGNIYSADDSEQQSEIVYKAAETMIKFLNNDPTYTPMPAIVIGCGGTGKIFIVNPILSTV